VGDREAKLVGDVEHLRLRIADLETRIVHVEAVLERSLLMAAAAGRPTAELHELEPDRVAAAAPGSLEAPASDAIDDEADEAGWAAGLPALAGRSIMALGGAFLLRALTERGAMPPAVGVVAGLAYALVWTFVADRAARAERKLDATLYGLVATMIALPLLAETSTRLGVLSPPISAATLTVVGGVLLWVAWAHGLAPFAWIVTLAATATGVVLLFATHALSPFAAALFALAAASLAASYHREWYGLRWPAALALDVLVLLAMYLAGRPNYDWLRPTGVATVQLLLTVLYLGIIGVRTLVLGNPMREFGVVQSLIVLAVGLEGARRMLGPGFAASAAFPIAALVLAAASWSVAFFRLERDPQQRANFGWYATLGTILAIYGTRLAIPGQAVGLIWALMALAAARVGAREDRVAVRWNAAACAVSAAFGSGLATTAYGAFFGADPASWLSYPPTAWAVTFVCLGAWVLSRWYVAALEEPLHRSVPGLSLLVVAAVGFGTALVTVLGASIAAVGTAQHDVAALAVLRTAVLVTASLLLAGMSRLRPRAELVWMAYAALVLAACKLAVEDLPNGRAMTMFLSLVLFGGALIAAPQLVPARNHRKSNGAARAAPTA